MQYFISFTYSNINTALKYSQSKQLMENINNRK